ncbi:microtubule-associated protein futsch-like, partial [Teratosphaeria destructans]
SYSYSVGRAVPAKRASTCVTHPKSSWGSSAGRSVPCSNVSSKVRDEGLINLDPVRANTSVHVLLHHLFHITDPTLFCDRVLDFGRRLKARQHTINWHAFTKTSHASAASESHQLCGARTDERSVVAQSENRSPPTALANEPRLPSSPVPTAAAYDVSVTSPAPSSSIASRGRERREDKLLSPDHSRLPRAPRTPAGSIGSRPKDDRSEYYTAVWGSPYDRTSSPPQSAHTAWSELVPSEDHLESSPAQFGLDHLIPSRLAHLSFPEPDPSLWANAITEEDFSQTPRSRTKRWVQLPEPPGSDKAHWWSDESRQASETEEKQRERQGQGQHNSRDKNRTLDQQTFLDILRDSQSAHSGGMSSGMYASRWADTPPPEEVVAPKRSALSSVKPEKPEGKESKGPNTEIPHNVAADKVKELSAAAEEQAQFKQRGSVSAKRDNAAEAEALASVASSPVKKQHLEPPRLRKRVSWRGKNCIISMPNLDFEALGLAFPLSHEEIERRLKSFEDQGYSTRGFDLAHDGPLAGAEQVHVKPVYPDEAQSRLEATQSRPAVMLPDLNKWKAYEDFLLEQKLAALGVDIGGDAQPAPAPAVFGQELSRQNSSQYPPLPFSPPIPTGSSGSMIGRPGMSRGHSHTMSVASPMSPGAGPYGHARGQSTFTGPFGFPQQQQQPQVQSPLGGPPQQQFPQPGQQQFPQFALGRNVSPAQLAALRPDLGALGALRGPGSPLSQQVFAQSPQDHSRGVMDQQRRESSYSQKSVAQPPLPSFQMSNPNQYMQQQLPSLHQTPALPELPEEDEEKLRENNVGIQKSAHAELPSYVPPHKRAQIQDNVAVPTPTRGHHHNISEGFERDLAEKEERHQAVRNNMVEVAEEQTDSTLAGPLKAQQERATDAPAIVSERDPLSRDIAVKESPKMHRKTASRFGGFNVAAPSFTFNPKAEFKPGAGFQPASSIGSNSSFNPTSSVGSNSATGFQAATRDFTFGVPMPQTYSNLGHTRQTSSGSLNVNAIAFMPSKPVTEATPKSAPAPRMEFGSSPATQPKSDFSFSSIGPTFKANAVPPWQPANEPAGSGATRSSIFGKVNIPEIVKPTRKNKAVAIVKPKSADGPSRNEDEELEDDDGRIMQSEDRLKRTRGGKKDDGDEVPRFAVPDSLPQPTIVPSTILSPDEEPPTSPLRAPSEDTTVKEVDEEVEEAEEEVADKAVDTVRKVLEDQRSRSSQPVEAVKEKPTHGHKHSSSLSALAMPFQPFTSAGGKPAAAEQERSRDHHDSISDLEDGEIDEREDSPSFSHVQDEVKSSLVSQMSFNALGGQHEPSFDEIDAVMRHLNEKDNEEADTLPGSMPDPEKQYRESAISELPPELPPLSWQDDKPLDGVTYLPEWSRSEAPSPSPRRLGQQLPISKFALPPPDAGDHVPQSLANGWPHQVHRLNKGNVGEEPMSDWSDMLSEPEEEKLRSRTTFFDSHVEDLIAGAIERRLQPFEEKLEGLVKHRSDGSRARSSDHHSLKPNSSTVESDADDEDDLPDETRQRPVSSRGAGGKDKKTDQIKAAVLEALREHIELPRLVSQSAYDIADLHSALADMKVSFARAVSSSLELDDIKAIVEDALNRQSQAVVPIALEQQIAKSDTHEHKRELSELEGRLNETLAGALEEANLRRAVEEREAETRRLLRLAEEEVQLLRDSSRDDGGRVSAMEEERRELHLRIERADEEKHRAEEKAKNLEQENEAMQETLDEYRKSRDKWLKDLDEAKRERVILEDSVATLERQVEEGRESSSAMKRRLERLHADMASAAGLLASEKAAWKAREDDWRTTCEALEAEKAAHARQRQEMEEELRVARVAVGEVADARNALDQMKLTHMSLEEVIRKLQGDLGEQQTVAAKWERDFHDVRESARLEVQRTRMALESEVELANNHVNATRLELESELLKMRTELETAKMEAETNKARHERMLEDEDAARREALRKVNHANSVALDEARSKYEITIKDMQALHARQLQHACEDKERSEYILNERLSLSDARLQHANDRILHLQERVEVAKSAAQAAAMSAQSRGALPVPMHSAAVPPEKISPQALRESILVLQEQLQEREARIEKLQNQVDKEGPAKLKQRDDEISWLRELLAVRSEDLTDLVNTLSQPVFDRDNVRDIAIRIRANLQMEQQEKERFGYGGQSMGGQALASLSSFATPKAAVTGLGSAFSKWRNAMESSALKIPPPPTRPLPPGHGRTATPSRPSSSRPTVSKAEGKPNALPPNYLEGLMTPPASNIRSTPSPETTMSLPPPRLQSSQGSKREGSGALRPASFSSQRSTSGMLFRPGSYDRDAEDSAVPEELAEDSFVGEADDDLGDVVDDEPPAFRNRSLEEEMEGSEDGEEVETPA